MTTRRVMSFVNWAGLALAVIVFLWDALTWPETRLDTLARALQKAAAGAEPMTTQDQAFYARRVEFAQSVDLILMRVTISYIFLNVVLYLTNLLALRRLKRHGSQSEDDA